MDKKLSYALVLLFMIVIVAIMSKDTVTVNLVFDTVRVKLSICIVLFTGLGLVIGHLLKR